ncbi:MAG TPA: aminopeptidase family protein P, partial [Methylocystis sp.]|nr:aminopeptidase family protein P [Methylocystis sp.]
KGARIGYDPLVHTNRQIDAFAKALAPKRAELVPVEPNPIDEIWTDRPAPPLGAVRLHPARLAGKSVAEKLAELRRAFNGANALLLSDPHSIAWTFNIRGSDVAHTPIALAFALIPARGAPTLYLDGRKIRGEAREALEKILVIAPAQNLRRDLEELGEKKKTVLFDQATAPILLVEALRETGGKPRLVEDPAALPKAVKNARELAGIRTAHVRDGVALTRFLAWFEREAVKGELTEIAAAQALETFRRESGLLRDISFPTISAFGPHAAIPHYRVTERSNLTIEHGIYLVDSGGQYLDGTTDVTRTVAVGYAARPVREHFTRVLKGHIAIATAVFPKGATGAQLDAMARRPLWEAGLDFDHGVGHGVGAYLSVHEGPQRIAKMGHTPLEPGMILSNEPGYYRAGEYGIRLENLVVVERREIKGGERDMLGFETITLAPFDLNLVEASLLAPEEVDWLNAYHARVRNTLSPLVDVETRSWLKKATRRLPR